MSDHLSFFGTLFLSDHGITPETASTAVFRLGGMSAGQSVLLYNRGHVNEREMVEDLIERDLGAEVTEAGQMQELGRLLKRVEDGLMKIDKGMRLLPEGKESYTRQDIVEAFSTLAQSHFLLNHGRYNMPQEAHDSIEYVQKKLADAQHLVAISRAWDAFAKSKEGREFIKREGATLEKLMEESGASVAGHYAAAKLDATVFEAVREAYEEGSSITRAAEVLEEYAKEQEELDHPAAPEEAEKIAAADSPTGDELRITNYELRVGSSAASPQEGEPTSEEERLDGLLADVEEMAAEGEMSAIGEQGDAESLGLKRAEELTPKESLFHLNYEERKKIVEGGYSFKGFRGEEIRIDGLLQEHLDEKGEAAMRERLHHLNEMLTVLQAPQEIWGSSDGKQRTFFGVVETERGKGFAVAFVVEDGRVKSGYYQARLKEAKRVRKGVLLYSEDVGRAQGLSADQGRVIKDSPQTTSHAASVQQDGAEVKGKNLVNGMYAEAGDGSVYGVARVEDLSISADVPQFKKKEVAGQREAANEDGTTHELSGGWNAKSAPIIVWRRRDGRLEVISGRHRLAHAKKNGVGHIAVRVYDEDAAHDAAWAKLYDVEVNILEGTCGAIDVAFYFRHNPMSLAEAEARGLMPKTQAGGQTAASRMGIMIATRASGYVFDSLVNGGVSAEDAYMACVITESAEGQELALKARRGTKGKRRSWEYVTALVRGAEQMAPEGGGSLTDLFGFDEGFAKRAKKMADYVEAVRKQLRRRIDVLSGAGSLQRKGEMTKEMGVKIDRPEDAVKIIERLARLDAAYEAMEPGLGIVEAAEAWDGKSEVQIDWRRGEVAGTAAEQGEGDMSASLTFSPAERSGLRALRELANGAQEARFRSDTLGQDVVFALGSAGELKDANNPNSKVVGAVGFMHLITMRMAHGESLEEACYTACKAVMAAVNGRIVPERSNNVRKIITLEQYDCVVNMKWDSSPGAWVITGYKETGERSSAGDRRKAMHLAEGYAPDSFVHLKEVGAALDYGIARLAQEYKQNHADPNRKAAKRYYGEVSFSVIGEHARTWGKYKERAFKGRDDGEVSFSVSDARERGLMKDGVMEAVNGFIVDGGADFSASVDFSHVSRALFRRPDREHVGSGEGNQVYGWGVIYGAESPEVNRSYHKSFSGFVSRPKFTKDGEPIDGKEVEEAMRRCGVDDEKFLESLYETAPGFAVTREHLEKVRAVFVHSIERDINILPKKFLKEAKNKVAFIDYMLENKVGMTVERRIQHPVNYRMRADVDDSNVLLWDESFDYFWANHEEVQDALKALLPADVFDSLWGGENGYGIWQAITGEGFYEILTKQLGSPRAASEWLDEHGIRGVKYLDGVSRGRWERREEDEPYTYNYVIFNPDYIEVIAINNRHPWSEYSEGNGDWESPEEVFGEGGDFSASVAMWKGTLEALRESFPEKGTAAYMQDILVCPTPAVMRMVGARELDMVITPAVIRKVTEIKHGVPYEALEQLPEAIADPVCIAVSDTANALEVITELVESTEAGDRNILVAVHLDAEGSGSRGMRVNRIASLYGKERIAKLLEHPMLYWNETKASTWTGRPGLQLPRTPYPVKAYDRRIREPRDLVKYKMRHGMSFSVRGEGLLDRVNLREMAEEEKMSRLMTRARRGAARWRRVFMDDKTSAADAARALGEVSSVMEAVCAYLPAGERPVYAEKMKLVEAYARLVETGRVWHRENAKSEGARAKQEVLDEVMGELEKVGTLKGEALRELREGYVREVAGRKLSEVAVSMVEQAVNAVERHLVRKEMEVVNRMAEALKPKKLKSGKLAPGKMSAEGYRRFARYMKMVEMSTAEKAERMEELAAKLDKETEAEKQEPIEEEMRELAMFGALGSGRLADVRRGVAELIGFVRAERTSWEGRVELEKEQMKHFARVAVEAMGGVDRNKLAARRDRAKKPLRTILGTQKGFMSLGQMWMAMQGVPALREMAEWSLERLARGNVALGMRERALREAEVAFMAKELGLTSEAARNNFLVDLKKERATGVRKAGEKRVHKVRVSVEEAREIVAMSKGERKARNERIRKEAEERGVDAKNIVEDEDVELMMEELRDVGRKRYITTEREYRTEGSEELVLSKDNALNLILLAEQADYREKKIEKN